MPRETTFITICMGSSCFSRGNKATLARIQEYVKARRLEDTVILKGAHCVGNCDNGPVIRLNEKELHLMTEDKIDSALDSYFGFSE